MRIENCYDILRNSIISEKTNTLVQYNKYSFRVLKTATKSKVKEAVEKIFSVKVTKINAANVNGKKKIFRGRVGVQSSYKKMIVSVEQGKTIDLSVGVK